MFAFAVRVWIQVYLVDPNTMWVAGWCIQALVKVITPLVAAEYFIASLPRLTVHFSHCTTNHSRGRGGILVRRSLIRSHLSRVVSPDLPKRLHVFYLRRREWGLVKVRDEYKRGTFYSPPSSMREKRRRREGQMCGGWMMVLFLPQI